MNPRIPADYDETGQWLASLARSHAKREDPRVEVLLDAGDAREGRSYALRLALEAHGTPVRTSAPVELAFSEAAEGRTRFAWCQAFGERIRALARELLGAPRASG